MKAILFTLIVITLSVFNCSASHQFGSDISYKHLGGFKYKVTIVRYRLCSGFTISNQTLSVRCINDTLLFQKTLTTSFVENLKTNCSDSTRNCSQQNTANPGEYGLEKHTFIDTLDFASADYLGLISCSGNITLEVTQCCRVSDINTTQSSLYYNYAEINLAMGNNSADFTSDPLVFTCCTQPVYYNLGAVDTSERDRITYSWDCPNLSYAGSYYSCNRPFQAYYPINTSMPAVPTATPPIGVYLNEQNGDLIYTPTSCTEVTPWGITATEWRKDSTGTYVIVGKTRRDIVAYSRSCPDNNTPIISGPYSHVICEEEDFCFNITTSDAAVTTGSTTVADTLLLSWNEGIPGADFTITNPSSRLKTGRFCWTPPEGSASSLPYTFTVTADDNHCNFNTKSYRAFTIRVNDGAKATVDLDTLDCNWYAVVSEIDSSTFSGNPNYEWTLLDSNMSEITDNSIAYFQSTKSLVSSQNKDSLKIQREGVYILRQTIKNAANCTKAYYDTLSIGAITTTLIGFAKDTTVCVGFDLMLNTTTTNASGPIDYQWYLNDSILVNDTLPYLGIKNFHSSQPISYKIQIAGADGCYNSDAIKIRSYLPYQDSLLSYYEGCFGDTILISLDSSLVSTNWSNGSSAATQSITQSEILTLTYTDSFGCVFSDSSNIVLFDLPQPNLEDSTFCGAEATIYPGDFDQYTWSTGSNNDSIMVYTSGTYSVAVTDSNTCKNSDSVNVSISSIPFFSLGNDTSFCGDTFALLASGGSAYLWNTGNTTNTEVAKSSDIYWLKLTDSNKCSFTDSIAITLLQNANVPILTRNGNTIHSDLSGSHQWFIDANLVSGASDSFISITAPGSYTAVQLDSNGCVSDTSNSILKTAGITKLKSSPLKIYPNPTNGQVTIDATGLGNVQSIKLYDAQGKLVENTQAINGSLVELVWTARIGVLWIVVETESATYREQIITIK